MSYAYIIYDSTGPKYVGKGSEHRVEASTANLESWRAFFRKELRAQRKTIPETLLEPLGRLRVWHVFGGHGFGYTLENRIAQRLYKAGHDLTNDPSKLADRSHFDEHPRAEQYAAEALEFLWPLLPKNAGLIIDEKSTKKIYASRTLVLAPQGPLHEFYPKELKIKLASSSEPA